MDKREDLIVKKNKKRYFLLDVARIICALAIFARHAQTMGGYSLGILINNLSINMTHIIMTFFFILSGFSIYISNKKYNLLSMNEIISFFKKRAISILPLYFFVHFVWIFFVEQDTMKKLFLTPIDLLGLQTIYPVVFGVLHNGGTWFISCLMISYFIYPYIQELIKGIPMAKRIIVCIGMICLVSYIGTISKTFALGDLYTNPLFRVLEFCTG